MSELESLSYEDDRELRGLWLSRVMFNPYVGWPIETRTYEQFEEEIVTPEEPTP